MTNEDKLKKIMSEVLEAPVDESTVAGDGNWDSLRHLQLVLVLEEQFNISFTEAETVQILSYKGVKVALERHGISFEGDNNGREKKL